MKVIEGGAHFKKKETTGLAHPVLPNKESYRSCIKEGLLATREKGAADES